MPRTQIFNLSSKALTFASGEVLQPLGDGSSVTTIDEYAVDNSVELHVTVKRLVSSKLMLNGFPFPGFDRGIIYIVNPELAPKIHSRGDIFTAHIGEDGVVMHIVSSRISYELQKLDNKR